VTLYFKYTVPNNLKFIKYVLELLPLYDTGSRKSRDVNKHKFQNPRQGQRIGLHYQGQGYELHFMFKATVTDFCFLDVKAKAMDTVSSRTFQGLLPTQCFVIYYTVLYRPKIYTSSPLPYYVVRKPI